MTRAALTVLLLLALLRVPLLYAHGDVEAQIEALNQKIQQAPSHAALYVQRADLQRHLQHWALAEMDLATAEQLDKKISAVHFSRALLFMESGQSERALLSINRFLEIEPQRTDAHETRGRILFALKQYGESEVAFSRAIALRDTPTPDLYLARHEAILSQGSAAQSRALTGLNEGISRIGSVVTLELAAMDVERYMKRWDDALRRVDRIAALSARKEGWLVRRAEILTEAGKPAEAHDAYAEALRTIEALPPRTRSTNATMQLEIQLRGILHEEHNEHAHTN